MHDISTTKPPIALALSRLRRERRLKLEWVATHLGVSVSSLRSVEAGKYVKSIYSRLPELAKLYEVELESLPAPMTSPKAIREHLGDLSTRLKNRRIELGLTRQELSEAIKVPTEIVNEMEARLTIEPSEFETAWERAIRVPTGWIRDTTMPALPLMQDLDLSSLQCADLAAEITAMCAWYSTKAPIHRTTNFDDLSVDACRMAGMMVSRFGVNGDSAMTLEAIGQEYGITKERVRQVEATFLERVPKGLIFPTLAKLEQALPKFLPCTLPALESKLRSQLGHKLTLASADQLSQRYVGRAIVRILPPSWKRPERLVGDPRIPDAEVVRVVNRIAFLDAAPCSEIDARDLAIKASRKLDRPVTSADVIRASQMLEGFTWLSEDDGKFWFDAKRPQDQARERVLNSLYKAEGASRSSAIRASIPPLPSGRAARSRNKT